MKFEYETDRLVLKILSTDWTENILDFIYRNRMVFDPYEPTKPSGFYTYEYQFELIKNDYLSSLAHKSTRFYVFENENPDTIIGTVSLGHVTNFPYCSCILGYKFDPNFQKKGYALEALQIAIEYAFKGLKLHKIKAYILEDNLPSINLVKKLGFNYEGKAIQSISVNGHWADHLRYTLVNYK